MHFVTGLTLTLVALTATTALAQPGRLNDQAYLQAARCVGIASSPKMGGADAAAINALFKSQSAGREELALQRATEAQQKGRRDANRADDYGRTRLAAELSGVCASLKN